MRLISAVQPYCAAQFRSFFKSLM